MFVCCLSVLFEKKKKVPYHIQQINIGKILLNMRLFCNLSEGVTLKGQIKFL